MSVVGYVRLSRDENKKNYSSIENQKMIIENYAKENGMHIDEWFEDDGVSGFSLERPAFSQIVDRIEKDIDVVIAKDVSRIGRHNAKVLLFIEHIKELGKKLILIDDSYDSTVESDDDILGIKTWFNERYVKDASKKVKRVIQEKQKMGTLIINAPFGYCIRMNNHERKIEVIEEEAEIIRRIFDMYINGDGFRNIARKLNQEGIKTPSTIVAERDLSDIWKSYNNTTSEKWTSNSVGDIIKNDYYTGVYRLNKRARKVIRGTDHRVPREQHIVFENHHEAIIDKQTYDLAQELTIKRLGNKGFKASDGLFINIFNGILYCADCGKKLTPISRTNTSGTKRKYYLCSTYNNLGKEFCSKAHIIDYDDLVEFITDYLHVCRDALEDNIKHYEINQTIKNEQEILQNKKDKSEQKIKNLKLQLKSLIAQKVKDLAMTNDKTIINETYEALQKEILLQLSEEESRLEQIKETLLAAPTDMKENQQNALNILDDILSHKQLSSLDVKAIISKITVDGDGIPTIYLKYGISNIIDGNIQDLLNKKENDIISHVRQLIKEDTRSFTSAKYLSAKLTEMGYNKSKRGVMPYINLMIAEGVITPSESKVKPYTIIKSR